MTRPLFPSKNKIFHCSTQMGRRRPGEEKHPCTMNELIQTWIHGFNCPATSPAAPVHSRRSTCWSLVLYLRAVAGQPTRQPDSTSRDCRCGSRASCGLSGATERRDGGILGGLSQCIDA